MLRPGSTRTGTPFTAVRHLWRAFRLTARCLVRSTSGASQIEYVSLVGVCTLAGLAGFGEYGKSLGHELRAEGKQIEGYLPPPSLDIHDLLGSATSGDDDDDDDDGGDDDGGDDEPCASADDDTPCEKPEPKYREPLECGSSGSYWFEGGGKFSPDENGKAQTNTGPVARPRDLERDHIPSTAALQKYAENNLDSMLRDLLECEDEDIDPEKRDELIERLRSKIDWERFELEVQFSGFTVAIPRELHRKHSRTLGTDRNTPEQIEEDAQDLGAAAERDIKQLKEHLEGEVMQAYKNRFKKTGEDCEKKIEAALDDILKMDDADYYDMIYKLLEATLESELAEVRAACGDD
jgi:hypothetical protein